MIQELEWMIFATADKSGPVPLYQQIRHWLREQIATGALEPHSRVPSERTLAGNLGISRMTVRAALDEMIREGLLYRVPGKGTYVAPPRFEQPLHVLTSFTEDMVARGLRPGGRVLFQGTVVAPDHVVGPLGVATGEPVIKLERLRLADGEPMSIETAYLRMDKCRFVLESRLDDRSLYTLLREHGLQLSWAEQSVGARLPSPREAQLLGIQSTVPVLTTVRVTYLVSGEAVEYVTSSFRSDRYTFRAHLRVKA